MQRSMVGLSFLLALGCASANLTVIEPLEAQPGEVTLSIVPSASTEMTSEQQSRLRSTITTAVAEQGVKIVPSDSRGSYSLEGNIERYDPGNRALRYFIGFGAGSGHFDSSWAVMTPDGSKAGECRVEGSIRMGAFGGSYDAVLEEAGTRVGEFISGN